MKYIQLSLISCLFLSSYSADNTFHYPPYIEIPCYRSLSDREQDKKPLSIVRINIGPNLTLVDLQNLIRDQKGHGNLVFMHKKIDGMPNATTTPIEETLKELTVEGQYPNNIPLEQFEILTENLFFILADNTRSRSGSMKIR